MALSGDEYAGKKYSNLSIYFILVAVGCLVVNIVYRQLLKIIYTKITTHFGTRAESVGSGTLGAWVRIPFGNPF